MDSSGRGPSDGFGNSVILDTDIVLAKARLSPLAIARGRRAGRMELEAERDGKVFLEVGGVVVAGGKVVARGGKSYFKVTSLAISGKEEETR